jgi:hypothetical protein
MANERTIAVAVRSDRGSRIGDCSEATKNTPEKRLFSKQNPADPAAGDAYQITVSSLGFSSLGRRTA